MKEDTPMTFDFDKAEEVIDRLRFIKDEEDWHDQIGPITRAAVFVGLSGAVEMRATGTSVNDPWYLAGGDKTPDGFLIVTNQDLIRGS